MTNAFALQALLRASFVLTAATTVAACGGGGSGGSDDGGGLGENTGNEHPLIARATSQIIREQLPDGENVDVAVVDVAMDMAHEAFSNENVKGGFDVNQLVKECQDANAWDNGGRCNLADGSDAVAEYGWDEGDSDHGNLVAGVLGGLNAGYAKNVNLVAADLDTASNAFSSRFHVAAGIAARQGYPVINISYDYTPVHDYHADATVWDRTDGPFRELDDVDARDAVIVLAGGNESLSYAAEVDATATWADTSSAAFLRDNVILVGALSTNGETLTSYSNHPGADSNVQDRWIVAQALNVGPRIGTESDYQLTAGTSIATSVVAAAMAELISVWPNSITAVEAAEHLLATADRSFTDAYDKDNCGPENNTNCGLFKFGQGRLDWDAVLEPSGNLQVAGARTLESTSVTSDGVVERTGGDVVDSQLALPAVLASAQASISEAVTNVHAFDELGRNYIVDLSDRVTTAADTGRLDRRMSRYLQRHAHGGRHTERFAHGGYEQEVSYSSAGRIGSAHLRAPLTSRLSGTAFTFRRGGEAPGTPGADNVALVSYQGGTPLSKTVDDAQGLRLSYELSDRFTISTKAWQGENALNQHRTGDRIRYTDVGFGYAHDGYTLEVGTALVDESHGFLGAVGEAGFSTGGGSTLTLHRVQGSVSEGAWRAFAQYQRGRVTGEFGDGLVSDVDATVEQIAAGVQLDAGPDTDLALVASTPLSAVSGTAGLSLANGINDAGNVTFQRRDADFEADSRPVHLELGVEHRIDEYTTVGANLINAPAAPGEDTRATGAVATFRTRF